MILGMKIPEKSLKNDNMYQGDVTNPGPSRMEAGRHPPPILFDYSVKRSR